MVTLTDQKQHLNSAKIFIGENQDPTNVHNLYFPAGDAVNHTISNNSIISELLLPIARVFSPTRIRTVRDIMLSALMENKRPTRIFITVMKFGFVLLQGGLLYLLILIIPTLADINIVWLCLGDGNSVVMCGIGIMVVLAGIIRTFAESSVVSTDEIFHLSPLPTSSSFMTCENCPAANIPTPDGVLETIPSRIGYYRDICAGLRWNSWSSISKHCSLVASLSSRIFAAQYSQHGMVVILRHSHDVDGPPLSTSVLLFGILRGFFQALILIVLTALLGSTYGSGILLNTMFVIAFLGVIVVSRTYSIYFCSWMERAVDTLQIEYHNPTELDAIRTILVGMPLILVVNTTQRRKYGTGYQNTACPSHRTSPGNGIIGPVAAVVSGTVCAVVLLALLLNFRESVKTNSFFPKVVAFVYSIFAIVFISGFVAEKVRSDFDFLVTHAVGRENRSEVISPA